MSEDRAADGRLARRLATEAGEMLLTLRAARGHGDQAALRAAGDKQAHDLLVTGLRRERPGDAVRSEEEVRDDPRRPAADRVWIVDPLDGTREYGDPGRTDWAVHVALWTRAAGLAAGAVALPAQGRVYATDDPPPYPPPVPAPPPLVVSRSRPPAWVAAVAREVGAEVTPLGSAGAKAAAVVAGEAAGYVHAGGQYEWDSAAPVAVALAAGLHATRLDGSPLVYNRSDPRVPELLVCRREWADPLLGAIARHREEM